MNAAYTSDGEPPLPAEGKEIMWTKGRGRQRRLAPINQTQRWSGSPEINYRIIRVTALHGMRARQGRCSGVEKAGLRDPAVA